MCRLSLNTEANCVDVSSIFSIVRTLKRSTSKQVRDSLHQANAVALNLTTILCEYSSPSDFLTSQISNS
jgi:hypothetical protein